MASKVKLAVAGVFALLAVFVDFTSKLLSVASDGILLAVAAYLVYQAVRTQKKG